MRRILRGITLFLICSVFCINVQSQNGVYISEGEGFYKHPHDPNAKAEIIDHKFIVSIDISSFSGKGQIEIKDTYDNSIVTYVITGKVRDRIDEANDIIAHIYFGNITIYGFSELGSILLFDDPVTKKLKTLVFASIVGDKSENHFGPLVPLDETLPSSGSGFLISQTGLIITNYHVVSGSKSISVLGINNDFQNEYPATLVAYDEKNDIALLKAKGISNLPLIPYSILPNQREVGDDIFVLGYPLLSSMGYEIKLTDGLISSCSGYSGITTYYQISSPIQPGNSGGPLFDSNGNVIGIVSAKLTSAENVGYAIKSKVLLDFLSSKGIVLKNSGQINNVKPLSSKVKELKKYIMIIKSQR